VAALEQLAPNAVALGLQVGGDIGKVNHAPGLIRGRIGGFVGATHLLEYAADLVCEVVHPFEVVVLGLVSELLVELTHPAGVRVHVKKLKAQQAIENLVGPASIVLDRGFDDLDDPGLFTDANPAGFLSAIVKLLQFAIAPLAVDVTGGRRWRPSAWSGQMR